jgi:proline iminopeptidase
MVQAIRVAAGLPPAVVVGHSIHGLMALDYAHRHPDSVLGTAVVAAPPTVSADSIQATARFFERDATPARRAAHERNLATRRVPDRFATGRDVVDHYVANGALYWYDPTFDARPLWAGVEPQLETWSQLGDCYGGSRPPVSEKPLFLGLGRYDYIVPYEGWEEARRSFPRLRHVLYPRSGHTPPYEEPQQFVRDLRAWTDSL